MNAIIAKESRPLVLPWCLAALAALILVVNPDLEPLVPEFANFIFFICIAILCSMTFGLEFQQRTLQLLLVQPLSRSRLWGDKILVLSVAVLMLGLLRWRIESSAIHLLGMQLFVGGFFLLSAVCSAGVWIGRGGSIAMGVVAGIATQLLVFSGLHLLIQWYYGKEPFVWGFEQARIIFTAGLIYSGLFVWLGWRFWKTSLVKLSVSIGSVLFLYAGYMLVLSAFGRAQPWRSDKETLLNVVFVVATACSSCFWTLVARSTLGGMVFNVASIFLISLGGGVLLEKLIPGFSLDSRVGLYVILSSGLVYSALFLWLGWWKFVHLEWRDNVSSEGNWLSLSVPWLQGQLSWLRCRPKGALGNLIRKELHLQKPVFTICIVFTLCWLVLLFLRWVAPVAPAWKASLEMLFYGLTWIYILVLLLLAGAISIGDEKMLGLAAWHLTLPVSAWRQWLVKIGIIATVGMLLGVVLPTIYVMLTLGGGPLINQAPIGPKDLIFPLLAAALVLTTSFWTAMFTASTLRALLTGMFALVSVLTCVFLSTFGLARLFNSQGAGLNGKALGAIFAPIIVTALIQSFLVFRRPQPGVWLHYSAILVLVAVLVSVWCFGFY
jgi:hypothetical protein